MEIKNYNRMEWREEAVRRFGEDPLQWKFVCPVCGHVQSPADFEQYKDQGATPDCAYFNCIGRYIEGLPKDARDPCNYSLGGLFVLNKVSVDEQPVFEFAGEEA